VKAIKQISKGESHLTTDPRWHTHTQRLCLHAKWIPISAFKKKLPMHCFHDFIHTISTTKCFCVKINQGKHFSFCSVSLCNRLWARKICSFIC